MQFTLECRAYCNWCKQQVSITAGRGKTLRLDCDTAFIERATDGLEDRLRQNLTIHRDFCPSFAGGPSRVRAQQEHP